MRFWVTGQGEREKQLKMLCQARGHELGGEGPWDLVVLPLPKSELTKEEAARLGPGQKIVCGMISGALERQASEKKWRLLRVLQDARYTRDNAVLSAEGAVYAAMKNADFALSGAACAVLGYGRIGKALTKLLRGLGAQVTVAARREESRREAGHGSIPLAALPDVLPGIQVLFNTVPAPILGREWLKRVSPAALLLELASAPYGIDLAAARELGLHAWLESGIPGRYCPKTAARVLLDYMEREVQNE